MTLICYGDYNNNIISIIAITTDEAAEIPMRKSIVYIYICHQEYHINASTCGYTSCKLFAVGPIHSLFGQILVAVIGSCRVVVKS